MKTEIIIAVRGELPANLARTVASINATKPKGCGVAIVWDDGDGPSKEQATQLCGATHHVPWSRARGCGQARNYGISQSDADVVILVDGHMEFPAGWVGAIMRHLRANPRDITCTQNQSVDRRWAPHRDIDSGARLVMHTEEPQVDPFGPRREFHGLSAKWNAGARAGVVAAPMGACYGMRRDWYDTIGQPLGILEAWGQDEELLGVCGALRGGRTYCLPVVTRHMHAAPHVNRVIDPVGIWANRLAVLRAIPGVGRSTVDYMRQTRIDWRAVDALLSGREVRIDALRARLQVTGGIAALAEAGIVTVNEPRMDATAARDSVPPVVRRESTGGECKMCGGNGWVLVAGRARCARCGARQR